jgi:hypothetical protein
MSYFFAGYAVSPSSIGDITNSFIDVVPPEIRKDIKWINEKDTFLLSYGSAEKTISDVIVHDIKNGSWLAIVGTPLVKAGTDEKRALLLESFLTDPLKAVRNELDGCFALLLYNARTRLFYTATDYNNTTPVFFSSTARGVYISSHELPLAKYLQSDIDPPGFSQTIQLKQTWGSYTRFKDIKRLLPCQFTTFSKNDKPSYETYWKPSFEVQWTSDFDDMVNRWLFLVKESVRAFYDCSKNKTVICEITAGEDARLLLAACHAIGLPFFAMVDGLERDIDVKVAREASRKTGFNLVVRPKPSITEEQIYNNATYISLMNDGYEDFFGSCAAFALNEATPPRNLEYVKYCGSPGGEAFRGSYYLRGKAFFPSSIGRFDHRFFTRMKYLLDFYPGLLDYPDEECKKMVYSLIEESNDEVSEFPVGIRIDHLLRAFQTCNAGLIYKNPRYLPFATKHLTRSVYNLPPRFKRGGRISKACTEVLYPELAFVRTQKGVPTVRRTPLRTFMFLPEYLSTAKFLMGGAVSRLIKWKDPSRAPLSWNRNAATIKTLLTKPPYSNWFSSSDSMITGHLYNNAVLNSLLTDAKNGPSRYVLILGRIISQELACRWIYGEKSLS